MHVLWVYNTISVTNSPEEIYRAYHSLCIVPPRVTYIRHMQYIRYNNSFLPMCVSFHNTKLPSDYIDLVLNSASVLYTSSNLYSVLLLIQLRQELRSGRTQGVIWVQLSRGERCIGHGAAPVTRFKPSLDCNSFVSVAISCKNRVFHNILQAYSNESHEKSYGPCDRHNSKCKIRSTIMVKQT